MAACRRRVPFVKSNVSSAFTATTQGHGYPGVCVVIILHCGTIHGYKPVKSYVTLLTKGVRAPCCRILKKVVEQEAEKAARKAEKAARKAEKRAAAERRSVAEQSASQETETEERKDAEVSPIYKFLRCWFSTSCITMWQVF